MKSIKVLSIVLIIIVAIPVLGFTAWLLKDGKSLNITLINKSMLQYRGSENQSLNYVLNKEKYLTTWGEKFNLRNDFLGLHWLEHDYRIKYISLREVEESAIETDFVYYSDAYGIRTSHLKELNEDERNKLEYGGINNTDYNFLKALLSHHKPTVIECTFFSPPTEPLVRYNIETLTDIYYVGWEGKYLQDLESDPDKNQELNCKNMYEEFTGEKWEAKGPGIVFYNTESKRIFYLEEGEDIETSNGLIQSSIEGMDNFNLPDYTNYNGRFSVLHPGRNKVISYFTLNPTAEGKEKLNEAGIPDTFPAVIEADNYLYYLAGDFGKNRVNMSVSQLSGLNDIIDGLKSRKKQASSFYYSYYYPFMSKILQTAYEMKTGE